MALVQRRLDDRAMFLTGSFGQPSIIEQQIEQHLAMVLSIDVGVDGSGIKASRPSEPILR
jgi:hypothetical protein